MKPLQKVIFRFGTIALFGAVIMAFQPSVSYGHLSTPVKGVNIQQEVFNDDPCEAYLQTSFHQNTASQAEKDLSAAAQKSMTEKSRAAAVGILFGVKYALVPPKPGTGKVGVGTITKAQAVKSYRTCHKKRALENLKDHLS